MAELQSTCTWAHALCSIHIPKPVPTQSEYLGEELGIGIFNKIPQDFPKPLFSAVVWIGSFCFGHRLLPYEKLSSIFGLYPPGASTLPPSFDNQKYPPDIPDAPWGQDTS